MRTARLALVAFALAGAVTAAQFAGAANAGEGWKPPRTVTIYCWSAAGGLNDLTSRALAASFKEQFDVPFNVVNMLGGSGGTAANHVWNQKHDGLSILGASDVMHGLGVRGAFAHPNDVWDTMSLIDAGGVISVRADSPIQSLEDLLAALKKAEESGAPMKAGASNFGSVWGGKIVQFNNVAGTQMNVLPFEGSTQTIVSLLSEEIDVILCGYPEQEDYIKSGKIRPLAMIELTDHEAPGVGRIPSLVEFFPEFADMKQAKFWCGIALPADCPQEVLDAYHEAFQKALTSKPVQELRDSRGVIITGLMGEDAKKQIAANDSVFAWLIHDSGLSTISPEKLGIPRP